MTDSPSLTSPYPQNGRGDPRLARPADWIFDHEYDGGDKSCGELILDLKQFFAPLPSGARVCVIARDEAAWIDIPAWCRVTGHGYLDEAPPYYLLERR